jgi:hypothetical protein
MPNITLHLKDTILQALNFKGFETKEFTSELVNDAFEVSLHEDLEDIQSW